MRKKERILKLLLSALRILRLNHPLKLYRSTKRLSVFLRDYFELEGQLEKSQTPFGIAKFYPCLDEMFEQSGTASGHYFHQDLPVANRMLKKEGKFYFSVPIGEQRIEFNAHRVFSVKYL